MTLTAAVRNKETKEVTTIKSELYENKQAFKDDIHRNGYSVIGRIYADGDENTRLGNLYWCHGVR